MKSTTDHDGESKTASGVDAEHYPELHEVVTDTASEARHAEIAELAYELWRRRGSPIGSAERDWFEASEMLRAKTNSANALNSSAGSVQR